MTRQIRKNRTKKELYISMEQAISYMKAHRDKALNSSDIAKHIDMSTSRFEHAFLEWVGTTPKRFLMHLKKEKIKYDLKSSGKILKTTYENNFSGPNQLHNLLVTHEAISPGELINGKFSILYGIHQSPFGWCLLGVTKRGVCHLSFQESDGYKEAEEVLKKLWPKADIEINDLVTKKYINHIFSHKKSKKPIHLLIKGTNFQIKVWEALLNVPLGKTVSYKEVAKEMKLPKAVRAVGTACGKNNIGFLIPCHRVLTSSGLLGGYRWGVNRKSAILVWESTKRNNS